MGHGTRVYASFRGEGRNQWQSPGRRHRPDQPAAIGRVYSRRSKSTTTAMLACYCCRCRKFLPGQPVTTMAGCGISPLGRYRRCAEWVQLPDGFSCQMGDVCRYYITLKNSSGWKNLLLLLSFVCMESNTVYLVYFSLYIRTSLPYLLLPRVLTTYFWRNQRPILAAYFFFGAKQKCQLLAANQIKSLHRPYPFVRRSNRLVCVVLKKRSTLRILQKKKKCATTAYYYYYYY